MIVSLLLERIGIPLPAQYTAYDRHEQSLGPGHMTDDCRPLLL